jgi:hypothetical protein
MGLYKGQNTIAGSYMLPRVDDIRQINVSGTRRSKKKREGEEGGKQRNISFTPFTTRGLMPFRKKKRSTLRK